MNFHGGNIYEYNEDILDFSSNINPFGVSKKLKDEIYKRMDEVARYPDINYKRLKDNVARYLSVRSDMVTVGNGAVDIIYRAVSSIPKDKVFIMAPAFSEYRKSAEMSGKEYFEISAFDFSKKDFDCDFFDRNIEDNSIIIVCNPNNPTGKAIEKERILKLLDSAKEKNSFVILDETFIEFTCDEDKYSMVSSCFDYDNLIVIRAVTKFFGIAGIRLGYGVCKNSDINFKIENNSKPWDVNTFAVICSDVVFWDNEYIEKTRGWIDSERKFVYENISKIAGFEIYETNSNFFMIKTEVSSDIIQKKLLKHNILIRQPEGFTGLSNNFIRVAVKDRLSNEKLINALRSEFVG